MKHSLRRIFAPTLILLSTILALGISAQPMPPENGKQLAPDFTLHDLQGKRYTLHELRGQVVVINFWATWCGPCRYEIPDLTRIYNSYKEEGVIVLGISLDDLHPDQIGRFSKNYKISYPVLHGPRSELAKLTAAYGGISSIPTTFIVDRDGYIAQDNIIVGARNEAAFKAKINPLL
ncbi:TlpA family protein disulfide reductase [Candidatus Neomarinimicrobiota bacterium]